MLVEEVGSDVSPKRALQKIGSKVMGEAQSLGLITSATNVIGFGETNRQRVLHLEELETPRLLFKKMWTDLLIYSNSCSIRNQWFWSQE